MIGSSIRQINGTIRWSAFSVRMQKNANAKHWDQDFGSDAIMKLAEEKGLYVIEDCAQAHGARYKGRPVGSFGHMAAFSFCQDKIMTTGGEGGMLVLDDEEAWKRAWAYKDHGKSWDAVYPLCQGSLGRR